MRLSSTSEARDAQQALASRHRELPLRLVTDQPLRTRMQSPVRKRLEREVLDQINHQLRDRHRRRFRGHVTVDLALQLPAARHGAAIPRVAKAYLDVLGRSAFYDDGVIDHLIVSCVRSRSMGATARIRCHPVDLFAANFDRSFRVAPELGFHDPDTHSAMKPWGLRGFDHHDQELRDYEEGMLAVIKRLDAEEERAFEEGDGEGFSPEVSESDRELADPQLRASLWPELEHNVRRAMGRKLTDQGFNACDRPGPPPHWIGEVIDNDLADVEHQSPTHPGCFALPPPPEQKRSGTEPSFDLTARRIFAARYGPPWQWGQALFGEPLAFDIAACGGAAASLDVDNLARRVIAAFNEVFRAAKPTIGGYRAYRITWGTPEIRVRVIPVARLRLLRRSLKQAEELILAERSPS